MDLWSESLQVSARVRGHRRSGTARASTLPYSSLIVLPPLLSSLSLSLQATDKATHWAALTLKEREETPYADFSPTSPGQGEVASCTHSSQLSIDPML